MIRVFLSESNLSLYIYLSSVIIAIIVCNSLCFNTIKLEPFSLITKISSTYVSPNSRYLQL